MGIREVVPRLLVAAIKLLFIVEKYCVINALSANWIHIEHYILTQSQQALLRL